jgi:hypothetical protein
MSFMVLLLREKTSDDFLVPRVRGTKLSTDGGPDVLGADEGRSLPGGPSLVNKAPTGVGRVMLAREQGRPGSQERQWDRSGRGPRSVLFIILSLEPGTMSRTL